MHDLLTRRSSLVGIIGLAMATVGFISYAIVVASTNGANSTSGTFPKVPPASALGRGHRVPSFDLPRLGGGSSVSPRDGSQPIVINFFASWCHDCVAELNAFGEVSNHSSGVHFVGIDALDSNPRLALTLLRDAHIRYPIGVDSNGSIAQRYLIAALPVTFFVSRSGVVKGELIGRATVRALASWVRYLGGSTTS